MKKRFNKNYGVGTYVLLDECAGGKIWYQVTDINENRIHIKVCGIMGEFSRCYVRKYSNRYIKSRLYSNHCFHSNHLKFLIESEGE